MLKRQRETQKTILSEHDVARMQTVEAMYDVDTKKVDLTDEVPDMSVGWYATPVSPESSQNQRNDRRQNSLRELDK